MKTDKFQIRSANDGDLAFIYNTLKKSSKAAYIFRHCSQALFDLHVSALIDRMLKNSIVYVVGSEDTDTHIAGFVIIEPVDSDTAILHFAYIKQESRLKGFFKTVLNLLQYKTIEYYLETVGFTYFLENSKVLREKFKFTYNPFQLKLTGEQDD